MRVSVFFVILRQDLPEAARCFRIAFDVCFRFHGKQRFVFPFTLLYTQQIGICYSKFKIFSEFFYQTAILFSGARYIPSPSPMP